MAVISVFKRFRATQNFVLAVAAVAIATELANAGEPMKLTLSYHQETSLNSERFHQLVRSEQWKPEETAIVVCDVWDYHHCLNAVRRLEEFVPRLNDVLTKARSAGVTIIHSPSDCMPAYENHPARTRAMAAPTANFVPHDCQAWCSVVPSEERAAYPIDQSDGGEDDDPAEHAEWAAKLEAIGRNPGMPWQKQSDMITIDEARDFISDKGDEVWNILQQQEIRNVILTGVHTNMCVLGRPFGLRQMARNGKNVVLMRDMTDTMYNPNRWPYVSHFTGTDLIVSHVERYICPTITSDQFLGGEAFRFTHDTRPHLVMLIAEDEYKTEETLPRFAVSHLGRDFRVTTVFGSDRNRNDIPGIDAIKSADVLLVSVRRRVLPATQMQLIRDFVKSGKPVIGIRTASHAFSLRNKKPPEGFVDWPNFDAEVLGGNYHGHYGNELTSTVKFDSTGPHKILQNVPGNPTPQGGSLYKTSPIAKGTFVLTRGHLDGQPAEPVTWTFQRAGVTPDAETDINGRSFYTSMGQVKDFDNPAFTQLLYQGICWASNIDPSHAPTSNHWSMVEIPEAQSTGKVRWYRCAVRFPTHRDNDAAITLALNTHSQDTGIKAWLNGHPITTGITGGATSKQLVIPEEALQPDDANLLTIRVASEQTNVMAVAPRVSWQSAGNTTTVALNGRWQKRVGDDSKFSNIPLPAKFGAAADIVFTLEQPLWTAQTITQPGDFTAGIEGPACDAAGNIFAVNFETQGTIGRVSPNGSSEVFVTLPEGSVGNGIRFDKDGHFFVADYPQHNILKINAETREITTFAHDAAMNQPNDLAISPDGTLYASDPNWKNGTGQLWRIDTDGTTTLLAEDMGTTNGIEVSPDGTTLYVNESKQRNVWAFLIDDDKNLSHKRLIKQFPDFGFDGMRCDVDGNLYITRHGKGTVIKMSPQGDVLQEVHVLGKKPSNLCFGGADGCSVYVTEVDGRRLVSFRVDRPGRAWAEQQK